MPQGYRIEVVQSLYDAVNRGDYARAVEYLHPEVEVCPALVGFDTAGAGSRSRLRGREEVRKFFEDNGETWEAWTVKSEAVTETPDGRLLSVERWYARGRDGIEFDFEVTDVYTFRDGLVARVDGYLETAEALEALGLSKENLDLVRRVYESFNRWGVEPSLGLEDEHLLHPEVEFHTYPNSPEAGIYRGPAAVIEYNQRLFGQFESVRIEVEELLPAGDRVVVISRQHAVGRTGHTPIVAQVVEVWTVRDHLLAERHTFATLAEALEAVGLRREGDN